MMKLGSQGLEVSRLGFGCMGLTTAYGGKINDADITGLLHKSYEAGINFWDTANIYTYAEEGQKFPTTCQEKVIAPALHEIGRDNIVMATKTGLELKTSPSLSMVTNSQPSFIRQQCEDSLRRLGVDTLDLFYIHRIDQTVPIEASMWEMKKLVEEKKIKYVGLSECSPDTIRRAHKVHPLTAVQLEYSLWCRGIEAEVLPVCKELGIGLVAYSPIGRGFFGGAHKTELQSNDFRNSQERFKSAKNDAMFNAVESLAKEKNCTPVQLALAWVHAQQHRLGGAGVVAIPGTTKEKNLLSNAASMDISLSTEDVAALEEAFPWTEVEGKRYGTSLHGAAPALWETDKNPPMTKELAELYGVPFEHVAT